MVELGPENQREIMHLSQLQDGTLHTCCREQPGNWKLLSGEIEVFGEEVLLNLSTPCAVP